MTYSSKLFARLMDLAKTPVFKDSFAGSDVRFSNEFEALELELAKAQSMYENNQVDWFVVKEQSEALLRDQSKDLRAGVWLTWALYQRESFQGLLAGLGLVHHLCKQHWPVIHPLKLRTRAATISWLASRLDQVLNENIPIKEQLPLFRHMVELLLELEALLALHLGDDVPLLLPICRRLSRMVQRAADSQSESGAIASVVAQVKHAASQLLEPSPPIDNEKDAHRALRTQQDSARPLCAWWLKQKANDVRALRLNRTLTWLSVDMAPERNAEYITALRGLPADKLKGYRERFAQGQFADLLVELEASLTKAPFWFDGQRMVWECLNSLKAELAMREVEHHLALLLQRLPGLAELRFSDGVPFADVQTIIDPDADNSMGSTVVALLLEGNRGACIWAGDSRCYLWREQQLYTLSRDHSLYQQLMDEQHMRREQALAHPDARALTRAIGANEHLRLSVLELEVQPNDVFLLCSDGLYQDLSHRELGNALSLISPQVALARLFDDVLSGTARDNLSAVVIRQ